MVATCTSSARALLVRDLKHHVGHGKHALLLH